MPRNIGSKLELWSLVCTSYHPINLVEHDLEQNADPISQGILPYEKKRSEESGKALESMKIGKLSKKIISELSQLLDLDERNVKEFYEAWMSYEYKESSDNLKASALEQRSRYGLLTKMVSYYYSDRIYCHLIMRHLISQSEPLSRLQDVCRNLFKGIEEKSKKSTFKLLLESFDALYKKKPVELIDSPLRHIMTDQWQSSWCYQILKEQILVLESMLIHLYYESNKEQSYLHELVDMFKTGTLTGQAHTDLKPLIEDIHRPLLARIEQLQVMILLVCMNLEPGQDCDESTIMNQQTPVLAKLDKLFIEQMGDFKSHSPLLLGWSSVRCGQIPAMKISMMGEKALSHDAFSYILNMLSQLEPQQLSDQLSAVTLYHLMSRILTLFDESALGDDDIITQIISHLLKYQTVADMVLQAADSDAVYRYIMSALQSFPLIFHPVLLMMSSLAHSSKESAAFVVRMLLNVPTYTEYLDRNSQINLQFISGTEVELLEPKILFGNPNIGELHAILPTGTIGLTTDSDGPPTVQWHRPFNVWDLLSCQLVPVSMQIHQVNDINVQERILSNTRLMASTFQHAPITGPAAQLIHLSIYRIIQGLASLDSQPTHTVASCLDLTTSLAKFTPALVIENLSQHFLPVIVSTGNDVVRKPWEAEIERSWLGHLIDVECSQSRYPALISTLKLICTTLMNSPSHDQSHDQLTRDRLLPTVLYILRAVLPSHNTWRYSDISEREAISELCVEMMHTILNTSISDLSNSCDTGNDKLRQALVSSLLFSNTGHTIINMIYIGGETLNLILQDQEGLEFTSCMSRSGRPSAVYRLGLCFSVLRRLLLIAQTFQGETVLESFLSSKPSNTQQIHLNRIIAFYMYQRHNTRLSVLSTQLLNTIAQETQISLLSSFGEDANLIKAGILQKLSRRSEDPRFKVVVTELFTTCVVKQTGLLEMFLSEQKLAAAGVIKSQSAQEISQEKSSGELLSVVLNSIESSKQFTHVCPSDLLLSNLNLILSLWCSDRQTITHELAKSEKFWRTLIHPLTLRIGDVSTGSMSHPLKAKIYCNILQILAYQLFHRIPADKLPEFHSTLKEVSQQQWCDMSKFVHSELSDIIKTHENMDVMGNKGDEQSDTGRGGVSDAMLRQSAAVHLLDSYRMFISTVILTPKQTVFEKSTCQVILADVLKSIELVTARESTNINDRLSSMLCSMYHELISSWFVRGAQKTPSNSSADDLFSDVTRVLSRSTNCGSDLSLSPNAITSLIATLQIIISKRTRTTNLLDTENSYSESMQTVLDCICNLLPLCCSKIAASHLSDECTESSSLHHLRVVLVSALVDLLDKLPDKLWISKVHESYLIQSIISSLSASIKTRTDMLFVETCVVFLMNMSSNGARARLVYRSVSENLTMCVTSLYDDRTDHDMLSTTVKYMDHNKQSHNSVRWSTVIKHITDIYTQILSVLHHEFIPAAALYISVHVDRLIQLIQTLSSTVNGYDMRELRSYIHLISALSKHRQHWSRESKSSHITQIMHAAVFLYQDCLLLLKSYPAIHMAKYGRGQISSHSAASSAGGESTTMDINSERNCLVDLMTECCAVMRNFTPDLCLLLNDITLDAGSYDRQVEYGFTHPSLDSRASPSYGTLISSMMYCVSTLSSYERSTSSDSKEQDFILSTKPKLCYILETTMYVMMSQVGLFLRSTNYNAHDMTRIKREISSEMNICLTGIDRYNRRKNPDSPLARGSVTPAANRVGPMFSTSAMSRSMSSPGSTANLPEVGLFNLAEQFVKRVLK